MSLKYRNKLIEQRVLKNIIMSAELQTPPSPKAFNFYLAHGKKIRIVVCNNFSGAINLIIIKYLTAICYIIIVFIFVLKIKFIC
jgi:hypothetical protein